MTAASASAARRRRALTIGDVLTGLIEVEPRIGELLSPSATLDDLTDGRHRKLFWASRRMDPGTRRMFAEALTRSRESGADRIGVVDLLIAIASAPELNARQLLCGVPRERLEELREIDEA
jgi:hypothetical protein